MLTGESGGGGVGSPQTLPCKWWFVVGGRERRRRGFAGIPAARPPPSVLGWDGPANLSLQASPQFKRGRSMLMGEGYQNMAHSIRNKHGPFAHGWILLEIAHVASYVRFFKYFFYLYFAKINGPPEILQKYTSAAVSHGVRGPTAARHGGKGRGPLARAHTAVGHGVRSLPPWRTAVRAYRRAAAWPPGRIFFGEFQFLKH
jgi:hypothetical protein